MIEDRLSLEDLLLATLEAGPLLTKAKGWLHHGEWGDWLHRVGLAPRTASMWMKLAGMDLTAEDVIERGGIVQTLRGGNLKSATVADLPDSNLGRDLAEAEAEIATTKQAYYDALSRRHRALTGAGQGEGGAEQYVSNAAGHKRKWTPCVVRFTPLPKWTGQYRSGISSTGWSLRTW